MNWLTRLFRCRHKHTTRVFTHVGGGMYVICVDCGRELAYDWDRMERGKEIAHAS